jgi:hypothetical protein
VSLKCELVSLRDLPAPAVSFDGSEITSRSGLLRNYSPSLLIWLSHLKRLEENQATEQATICDAAEICKQKKPSNGQIFVVEGRKHET